MKDGGCAKRFEELIYREAALLDEKKWQDWLALYTGDAVF